MFGIYVSRITRFCLNSGGIKGGEMPPPVQALKGGEITPDFGILIVRMLLPTRCGVLQSERCPGLPNHGCSVRQVHSS